MSHQSISPSNMLLESGVVTVSPTGHLLRCDLSRVAALDIDTLDANQLCIDMEGVLSAGLRAPGATGALPWTVALFGEACMSAEWLTAHGAFGPDVPLESRLALASSILDLMAAIDSACELEEARVSQSENVLLADVVAEWPSDEIVVPLPIHVAILVWDTEFGHICGAEPEANERVGRLMIARARSILSTARSHSVRIGLIMMARRFGGASTELRPQVQELLESLIERFSAEDLSGDEARGAFQSLKYAVGEDGADSPS